VQGFRSPAPRIVIDHTEAAAMIRTDILYQPSYALARVTMDRGDQIRAEAGSMVSMSGTVQIETKATGGLMKSLSRSFLGGESFFQNTFTATADGSEVTFAPHLTGDIMVMELANTDLIVQSGSYLASDMEITVDSKWGGSRSFFGGEGLFMLKCSGTGTLIVSSYGAIHKVSVPAGQTYIVDTGHIVAFDSHMTYNVRKAGSWKSTIFGGEGFVCEFQGGGDIYLQTRSAEAFLGWLIPRLPQRSSN
jgi:uncharacterized protein (TIGR00266 family)